MAVYAYNAETSLLCKVSDGFPNVKVQAGHVSNTSLPLSESICLLCSLLYCMS